ncbi:MAG: ATP-binding cassette domain-containing protein [Ignavibacteriaceae bacterium]|nr:ATP-binding cassette domain-containing protein [Ignavibacteriaceae bacterium]
MLEVKNLRKEYSSVTAVDDISFSIEPGKIFGLMGPNGAGKTTTIRMILDIIRPTSGDIHYNGKNVGSAIYNITGYLPEERGLYKKSKVNDVIMYFAGLKGLDHSAAAKNTKHWLKKLEMEAHAGRKIQELSKGNQQKIQFICSVVHDPQILILDEPFSGFDPINQQLIKDEILGFVNAGKIIVLSTHQMDIAEKLCESIFLINKGREVCSGNISEVKKQFGTEAIKIEYSGDASFLKTMPEVKTVDLYQNFAEVELVKGSDTSDFLMKILPWLNIRQFSVLEPTLYKIFIDVIKQTGGAANE